jgi:hypothetical protein
MRDVVPQANNSPGYVEAVAKQTEAADNARKLKGCTGLHGFVAEGTMNGNKIGEPTGMLRCMRCQGRVTADQARWYRRGLADGRNNP